MVQRLEQREIVDWSTYNIYTVGNVAKKVLLGIPGGLFGPEGERRLLASQRRTSGKEPILSEGGAISSISADSARLSVSLCTAFLALSNLPHERNGGGEVASHCLACSTCTRHAPESLATAARGNSPNPTGSCRFNEFKDVVQLQTFREVMLSIPLSHRQVAVLILGILHQMIAHATFSSIPRQLLDNANDSLPKRLELPTTPKESCDNQEYRGQSELSSIPLMTLAEGVVKSVVGSLFHSCTKSVSKVELAAQVLRELVLQFPVMGGDIIDFYQNLTSTTPQVGTTAAVSQDGTPTEDFSETCPLCPDQISTYC